MTYVVTDNCINCKHTDCVAVCPVDCFYEGENFLVIKSDECIDCGVCEPECPVGAILPDTATLPEDSPLNMEGWVTLNDKMADSGWPVLVEKKDPMEGHEEADGQKGKLELLSEKPGEGDL